MRKIIIFLFSLVVLLGTIGCSSKRKDIVFVEQGKILFGEGKYQEAILPFTKAIRRNTLNDESYAYRGFCQFKLENYTEALIDFSTALNRNPENSTALFGEAIIRWDLEDYQLAFDEFDFLLSINPLHNKAYYYRGRAYFHFGDTIRGIEDLEKAMELDSCLVDTYYLLSSIKTEQKKYDEADYYLELALNCKQIE